jgi:hypothetical protein
MQHFPRIEEIEGVGIEPTNSVAVPFFCYEESFALSDPICPHAGSIEFVIIRTYTINPYT